MKLASLGIACSLALAIWIAPGFAGDLKSRFSSTLQAKSSSIGEIASALERSGNVRVIVVVKVPDQSQSSLATLGATKGAKLSTPSAQSAVKRSIANAIDRVVNALDSSSRKQVVIRFNSTPAFAAELTKSQLEQLAKNANVLAITYDMPMQKLLDQSLTFDGVPQIHSRGATGSGRAVVLIDDGVQRDHPFLGVNRLISGLEACFAPTATCANGTTQQIGTGAGAATGTAEHGTHVAGIALGSRISGTPSKGNAPSAKLVPINIFGTSPTTSFSLIIRAFEQAEAWVGTSNPNKISAVSMSVGGGSSTGACDTDSTMAILKPIVDRLRAKGVLSVVAAGNDSFKNAMSFPACLSSIVSVGAIKRNAAAVSSYSNVSASTDVLAPGGDFDASGCVVSSVRNSGFAAKCGTSMATPQVSGIIAALKTLVPNASSDTMELALKNTGESVRDQRVGGLHTIKRVRANLALDALTGVQRPTNDNFTNAVNINSRNRTLQGTNAGATLETGERRHAVSTAANSVWWKITPGVSGRITLDTFGSSFDTVLAVYSNATNAGNGSLIVQNDDFNGDQSKVSFPAVAGVNYHIAVAGLNSSSVGNIALRISAPAINDNFSGISLGINCCGPAGTFSGNNFLTTKQIGEPNHAGRSSATSSVWASFLASASGPVTLETVGSDFDTVIGVYTGSSVGTLRAIASNDDIASNNLMSRVTFNATAGVTYRVAIAGYNNAQGNWRLSWVLPGAFSMPYPFTPNNASSASFVRNSE